MSRSAVALVRSFIPSAPASDAQLLRAFAASRADSPFEELVRRHGPMVLAVCRRVLADRHDAEDAFQATFLVLARKPGAVRGTNLAGWLYAVAVRTARGVRAARDRRRKRERASGGRPPPNLTTPPDSDAAAIIDEELAKLPELYRVALVLCELRGVSRRRAAAELGIPEGTLSSRLAGAKRRLAVRLAARGVAPAVGLSALLAPAAVSAELVRITSPAVCGTVGRAAEAAASAVVKAMLFDRLRAAACAVVLCAACACGGFALTGSADAPAAAQVPAPRPVEDPAAKLVARLGSADFAAREAAEKALRELGPAAKAAVLAGAASEHPEVARRCAAILPALRFAEWRRLREAFERDPKAFDHPVWVKLKAIAGDGADARAILADLLADGRAFVAVAEAVENPEAADRLHRQALDRLVRERAEWRAADPKKRESPLAVGWVPTRGPRAAAVLLGTFPGTGAYPSLFPIVRLAPRAKPRPISAEELAAADAFHACTAPSLVSKGPPPPAAQRLFVAWVAGRSDGEALTSGFALLRWERYTEGAAAARAVASDPRRPPRARGQALLHLGTVGTAGDAEVAATAFNDAREFESTHERMLQVRDLATAVALRLHGEEPADWGFSAERGAGALKNVSVQSLGFTSNFVRDPLLKAAQAKVAELTAARAGVAPAPRAKP